MTDVEIRGTTAIITTPRAVHDVDISNPESPTVISSSFPCPVPGCDFTTDTQNALGPHLAAHRRRGDPGTPPGPVKRVRNRSKVNESARKTPKAKPKLTPADVTDGVLALLYPDSIPTHRVREVAAWIETTERLAWLALADQAEPEETP